MECVGKTVFHKSFGEGIITSFENGYLSVTFSDQGDKKFVYPNAFEGFLETSDPELAIQVKQDLESKAELDRLKAEQKAKEAEELRIRIEEEQRRKRTGQMKYVRENVAFKCNYCDGGTSSEQIGFNGVCSDEIIKYNIEDAHRSWCSYETCPCLHYHNGQISRDELEDKFKDTGFVCYESSMLRDWKAQAGTINYGEKKGTPMKLAKVQINSLCVLTTREPSSKLENDRIIFALFIVDDIFEGDEHSEGYVSTNSEYKIKFSPEQARQLRFWKYHKNDTNPEKANWAQGLHRYLTDTEAIQILRDAIAVKKGTDDEKAVVALMNHFCDVNRIDPSSVGDPEGALTITERRA